MPRPARRRSHHIDAHRRRPACRRKAAAPPATAPRRVCRPGQPSAPVPGASIHASTSRSPRPRARRAGRLTGPTYHSSCGSNNTNPRSMVTRLPARISSQPRREYSRGNSAAIEAETDCIQQQVLARAVDEMAGDQPPVLAVQDCQTLIAQQLSPGIAGQAEQNQHGSQQSNEPGALDRRHGCRGPQTPWDGVTHAFRPALL